MSFTIRQICLVAEKLQPAIDDFRHVLGIEVCHVDPNVAIFGLENCLLPIGTNFMEIVAPIQENTAAGRYLERRGGEGGYMILLQANSAGRPENSERLYVEYGRFEIWNWTNLKNASYPFVGPNTTTILSRYPTCTRWPVTRDSPTGSL